MKNKRALLTVFVAVLLDLVGFGILIPVQPFLAESLDASPAIITLVGATYSAMQFIFAPLWGRLSDRIGRRPVMISSIAFGVCGYLLLGFADSIPMLFAGRALAGFGNANLAVAQAVVSDVTTAENRAKGMGMLGAAFGLGFIIGPIIGGFASRWGLHAPALVAGALARRWPLHGDHGEVAPRADVHGRAELRIETRQPGQVAIGGAGVDHETEEILAEEVHDEVVDHAASLVQHTGVQRFARHHQLGHVVGQHPGEQFAHARTVQVDGEHVRHVEHAGRVAHGMMFLDLRAVVHGHVPAAEIDHARAQGAMHGIQRGGLQCRGIQ